MNAFIEKNKRLLRVYCIAARIIGWLLLITAGIWAIQALSGYSRSSIPFAMPITIFLRIIVGLVLLGVAQFIRYLSESEYKAGWILRNGDKILYLYAVLRIVMIVRIFFHNAKMMENTPYYYPWAFLEANCLPVLAGALTLVGLGQILRRIMPVIEESKTLV